MMLLCANAPPFFFLLFFPRPLVSRDKEGGIYNDFGAVRGTGGKEKVTEMRIEQYR